MEDELALSYQCYENSAYWGIVFFDLNLMNENTLLKNTKKRDAFLDHLAFQHKKLVIRSRKKMLLIKNPPHTARIKNLLTLYPEARFIFLIRNPYEVFFSMKKLWSKINKNYGLRNIQKDKLAEIIYKHYHTLMGAYENEKGLIPTQNLLEVRYEDLIRNPIHVLNRVYKKFNLEFPEKLYNTTLGFSDSSKRYQRSNYKFDTDSIEEIYEQLKDYIEKWKYSAPISI